MAAQRRGAGTLSCTGRPDQSDSRENPQGNNRVRGIGAATATRDYFITDIPFDSYNSSGVTISRGKGQIPATEKNARKMCGVYGNLVKSKFNCSLGSLAALM